MASRIGPRPTGSDGNDFKHREKVASHYQESVARKISIRKSLLSHMFLTVLSFGRLLSISMGIHYFNPPELWEMLWLLSGIGSFFGFGSLRKNSVNHILLYLFTNIVFGIIPLVYGVSVIVKESFNQYKQNVSFSEWKDAPVKLAVISLILVAKYSRNGKTAKLNSGNKVHPQLRLWETRIRNKEKIELNEMVILRECPDVFSPSCNGFDK
eukprot:gene296-922_t